jgi:hypothetical protein
VTFSEFATNPYFRSLYPMIQRTRRTEHDRIAALEAQIAAIKAKAARKKAAKDPSLRHISAAVRSVDKALAESGDAATRQALSEARSTLSACLSLNGVVIAGGTKVRTRRVAGGSNVDETALLAYVEAHPGERGEQIAEALGTDSKTVRPVMQRLIAERRVKTRGQRRGMTYAAV